MKEGWEYKTIGEIATIRRGLTYKKEDEVEKSNKIVLRSNNVDLETHQLDFSELKYLKEDFEIPEDKMLKEGDLLMCMSNGSKIHLGKVALIDHKIDYAFGGFMSAIEHDECVSDKYFYYSLISPTFKKHIKKLQDGANINNLKVRDIEDFTIPVPSLAEQQQIVSFLDSEFEKIDALKANAEKQLQAAKDLFQAALKELLTPKEGWVEKKLKEIGKTQTGCTPSMSNKDYYNDNYIPFVKPSEINYDGLGGINYETQMLSKLGANAGRVFPAKSIFMVCIGATISKLGYSVRDVSCNQQINVITPNEMYDYKYIYYAMLHPHFIQKVIKEGTSAQATLPIISKGKWEVLSIKTRYPSSNASPTTSTLYQPKSSNFKITITKP